MTGTNWHHKKDILVDMIVYAHPRTSRDLAIDAVNQAFELYWPEDLDVTPESLAETIWNDANLWPDTE